MRLLATILGCAVAGSAAAQSIVAAEYTDPTTRYPHGILGDQIEHAGLSVTLSDGSRHKALWPAGMVFEDTEPRLFDLDGDGAPEVITVESSDTKGGRLSVWGWKDGALVLMAASPHIGRRFRWLAVAGVADMDGDGSVEIAYVDRPHLAKVLKIMRYIPQGASGRLVDVAAQEGLTNHRIGERDIGGGLRECDGTIEVITASADWSRIVATALVDAQLVSRDVGPHNGRASLAAALTCQ